MILTHRDIFWYQSPFTHGPRKTPLSFESYALCVISIFTKNLTMPIAEEIVTVFSLPNTSLADPSLPFKCKLCNGLTEAEYVSRGQNAQPCIMVAGVRASVHVTRFVFIDYMAVHFHISSVI